MVWRSTLHWFFLALATFGIPVEALLTQICESRTGTVSCPRGYRIYVNRAFYGRRSYYTPCSSDMRTDINTCESTSSGQRIKRLCDNQLSCTIPANNDFFGGDPCDGFYKYAEVHYECKPQCNINHCKAEGLHCLTDTRGTCSKCEDNIEWKPADGNSICEAQCSFHNQRWCWPGHCGSNNLARDCVCQNDLFSTMKNSNGDYAKCHLTKKPTISTCMGSVISEGNVIVPSTIPPGESTECENQRDGFINASPLNLTFKAEFLYDIAITINPKHDFVLNEKFGIVDASVQLIHTLINGRNKVIETKKLPHGNGNPDEPKTNTGFHDVFVIKSKDFKMSNGESLCLRYKCAGSGILTIANPDHQHFEEQYNMVNSSFRDICFYMDTTKPTHCSESGLCTHDPIVINQYITREDKVQLSISGWKDPDIEGTTPVKASGIRSYEVNIYRVPSTEGDLPLNPETKTLFNRTFDPTSVPINTKFTLPSSGLYEFELSVVDSAGETGGGNVRKARRFVLFDHSSSIVLNNLSRIDVLTAHLDKKGANWQLTLGPICFSWTKRFYNTYLKDNYILKPVKKDNSISGVYEHQHGEVSINGTENVDGIIEFQYMFLQNNRSIDVWKSLGQLKNQSACVNPSQRDGDLIELSIVAIDIFNNTKQDSVMVKIDSSPPEVEDIWLQRNGEKQLYVHNSVDLNKMNLSFTAFDHHSGLQEIRWKFSEVEQGSNLGNGATKVNRLSEGTNCRDLTFCYCPSLSVCEHRIYSIDMRAKVNNKGNHNRRYHFSVFVKNNANLSTTQHIDILVDSSAPINGSVTEGPGSGFDIDYTSENKTIVRWTGFIDHESGIKFYKVAVSNTCLSKQQILGENGYSLPKDTFIRTTEASSASVTLPNEGKYYTTVLAFNNAMEPSEPSCSDGITYDTTPLQFSDFRGNNFVIEDSIACIDSSTWLIRNDLTRIRLLRSFACDVICSNYSFPKFISVLPIENVKVNDTDYSEGLCNILPPFGHSPILTSTDTLDIDWNFFDEFSQLRDFEIGFGRNPSEKGKPSIQGMGYKSTSGRPYYKKFHAGLNAAEEFWIFLKSINKAGIENVVPIGPILIDQSPPQVTKNVKSRIGENFIYIGWSNGTFIDPEHQNHVHQILFRIGNVRHFITPFLQSYDFTSVCQHPEFDSCVRYPLDRISVANTESEDLYFVELHVYNRAGLYTTVRSDEFLLPSRIPPATGTVFDINPKDPGIKIDADVFIPEDTVCVRWEGFSHHFGVTYRIGIGTTQRFANVLPFHEIKANSSMLYCPPNVTLHPNIKYFSLVEASCSRGSTIGSSDGFVIIDAAKLNRNITVLDGNDCEGVSDIFSSFTNTMDTQYTVNLNETLKSWRTYTIEIYGKQVRNVSLTIDMAVKSKMFHVSDRHIIQTFSPLTDTKVLSLIFSSKFLVKSVSVRKCEMDIDIQTSTNSISVNWKTALKFKSIPVIYRIAIVTEETGNIQFVTEFEEVIGSLTTTFNNLNVRSGLIYRAIAKMCFGHVCTKGELSDGLEVYNISEKELQFKAELANNKSCSVLHLTSDSNFRDPKVAKHNIVSQWSLSRDDRAASLYTPWKMLDNTAKTISTCLPDVADSFTAQSVYVCIRSLLGTDSASVSCKLTDVPLDLITSYRRVFDVKRAGDDIKNMVEMVHSNNVGKKIFIFQQNEIDYAIPGDVIGGMVMGTHGKNTTFYLMRKKGAPTSPEDCQHNIDCLFSVTTSNGYVFFEKLKPTQGDLFHICVQILRSGNQYLHQSSSTSLCSDGVFFDASPPIPGKVTVKNSKNGFLSSPRDINVQWSDFKEDAQIFQASYLSPIAFYEVGLGSEPDADDIDPFQLTPFGNSRMLSSMYLENFQMVYLTVRATNHANLTTVVSSEAIVIDTTPPKAGKVLVMNGPEMSNVINKNELNILISDFKDTESGLLGFWISLIEEDGKVLQEPTLYTEDTVQMNNMLLQDGHTYHIMCRAENYAGLDTVTTSSKFKIDSSPPESGVVFDGLYENTHYQTRNLSIVTSWSGFRDDHSGLNHYEVALGTKPYLSDIQPFHNVGLTKGHTWNIKLTQGQRYYTTVKGCNGVNLCVTSASDGILIDSSPPITGLVHVGGSDGHSKYLSESTSISLQWIGFEDPQSGIDHFEWCIGTSKYNCSVTNFMNSMLTRKVYQPGLNLPVNSDLYVAVKVFNKAGQSSLASSDSFRIDTSPPKLLLRPFFLSSNGQYINCTSGYQWEDSVLRLGWDFADSESGIASTHLSFLTHNDGHVPIDDLKLGNENRVTLTMKLSNRLMSGDKYTAVVTVCNSAHLCRTEKSDTVTIDSSPPHIGGFEYPLKWKTSTSTSLLLSWYGFSDPESEIKQYYITISETYSGSEISDGLIVVNGDHDSVNVTLQNELDVNKEYILTLLAENNVGLFSEQIKITVQPLVTNAVDKEGNFIIVTHSCKQHFCNGDCTCAAVGGKCQPFEPCINLSNSGNQTSHIKVYAGLLSRHRDVSASTTCLSGHWNIESEGVQDILRFEWTVGIAGGISGEGIFNVPLANPWNDVGLRKHFVYCLPQSKYLKSETYVVSLRTWYSSTSYSIVDSQPIRIDHTPPRTRMGAYMIDSLGTGCQEDIDFSKTSAVICACWTDLFNEDSINTYEVMMGSKADEDDVVGTRDVGAVTFFCPDNLALIEGTKYFFTVRAYSNVGLHTTISSDGFVVDNTSPSAGIVFNSLHHSNTQYQAQTSIISASWHGFQDHFSHIKEYRIALFDDNGTSITFQTVGMRTAVTMENLALLPGHSYFAEVTAVDAAGLVSEAAKSPSVKIDNTPPTGFQCGKFLTLYNFSSQEKFINFHLPISYNHLYRLNIDASNVSQAFTATLRIRSFSMILPFADNDDLSKSTEYFFLNPYDTEYDLNVTVLDISTPILNASLYQCVSVRTVPSSNAILVKQISPGRLAVQVNAMDQESSVDRVHIGAGTTQGGYQLQPLHPVSGGHHGIINIKVSHGTKVYVTAVVTNKAELTSYMHSKPITMDHTPPEIRYVRVKTKIRDEQNMTSCVADVEFDVHEYQSNIKTCFVAIGTLPLASNLEAWTKTAYTRAYKSGPFSVTHGTKVYATVKCINTVELSTISVSSPVTIVSVKPTSDLARVEILTTMDMNKENSKVVQAVTSNLTVRWNGFCDTSGLNYYAYRLIDKTNEIVPWTRSGRHDYASMCHLNLQDGKRYTVEVIAANQANLTSQPISSAPFLVESRSPTLTGVNLSARRHENTVTLVWSGVFEAPSGLDMTYILSVGTRDGYTDLVYHVYTSEEEFAFETESDTQEVYVALKGILPTGAYQIGHRMIGIQ